MTWLILLFLSIFLQGEKTASEVEIIRHHHIEGEELQQRGKEGNYKKG